MNDSIGSVKQIRVAATGLDGLVGSRIQELLKDRFIFIPIYQKDMDITDATQVSSTLARLDFDIFLHLAAYTNVDAAESDQKLATAVNVEGTRHIFEHVSAKGRQLIYISTDFVFDGMTPPFDETATPHPLNVYGATKFEGEKIVKGEGMIVRISYPYRAHYPQKADFVRSIMHLLAQGTSIKGISDHFVTLTFIDDIAYALGHLIENFVPQTYHVVGVDSLSTLSAIHEICNVFDLPASLVIPTTSDEFYKGKAPRPKNGIVISRHNTFHPMKTFREGLEEMKKQMKQ